jgi:hypothetical protein
MKKPLSKLERVPLREAWKHEANDFTPWLAEEDNLNTLADALGLPDLELVATEHWVGEFKLDILCTSGDDQVIIENQLEKTNHTHLGQILTYAAGTGAKKVIWVAESFRPEHVAALDFLNQNTTEELSFFAVEVELWRIGDSPFAPKFEVMAKPNDWAKSGREQTRVAANATPAKQRQLKLWTELVDVIKSQRLPVAPLDPQPKLWTVIHRFRPGCSLNARLEPSDNRLNLLVRISHTGADEVFAALLSRREELETALGFVLEWQTNPDAFRIITSRPDSPIEDETQWGAYLDWYVQRIVKMNALFRPLIQALG